MLKLNDTSEQSILNMLVEHKSISSQQLKQIETLSNEGGKTKLETAIELNFATLSLIWIQDFELWIFHQKDQK